MIVELLIFILPIFSTIGSLVYVSHLMKEFEYAVALPWINLILVFICGIIGVKTNISIIGDSMVLLVWCIISGITNLFSAVILFIWLTHTSIQKIPLMNDKGYYLTYIFATLIPQSVLMLCWFHVCLFNFEFFYGFTAIILECIGLIIFTRIDWKLKNERDMAYGNFVRISIFLVFCLLLIFLKKAAIYWCLAFGTLYFIRHGILRIKRSKLGFDEDNAKIRLIERRNHVIRYIPIVYSIIIGILFVIFDYVFMC